MNSFSGLLGASVQLVFVNEKFSDTRGIVHEISQRPCGQDVRTFLKVQLPSGQLCDCVCPPDYVVKVGENTQT